MTGLVSPQPSSPPRTSRRRAIVVIAAGLLIAGAAIGGLWAWIAPPIHGVVALTHDGDRVHDYLGDESELFFVAPFLMLGLLNVVAAVAAVLAWQWRAHRGPAIVIGLCAGVVIAAGAAVSVGALLVHLRYGAVDLAAVPVSHGRSACFLPQREGELPSLIRTGAGWCALVIRHSPLIYRRRIPGLPARDLAPDWARCAICHPPARTGFCR